MTVHSRSALALYLVLVLVGCSLPGSSRPLEGATGRPSPTTHAGETPSPLPVWQWQNPRPQGNNISAAACLSDTICIAGSGTNLIRTTDKGGHWAVISLPVESVPTALSCPSAAVCFATLASGGAVRTSDGGQTWTELATGVGDDSLVAISCPTTDSCLAIGSLGSVISTSDDGLTWVSRRNGAAYYSAYGISCTTSSRCYLATPNGLFETVNGGITWGLVLAKPVPDVTCPSVTTCFTGGSHTYRTNDGGGSWEEEDTLSAETQAIACSDESHCIQVVTDTNGEPGFMTTVDGRNWAQTGSAPPSVSLVSLGCAAGHSVCLSGGTAGALFFTGDAGHRWTEVDAAVTRENLAAISCQGGDFCVAVGYNPNMTTLLVVLTRDGGVNWGLTQIPGDDSLTAVSCASTTVCVVVGLNANIATTHDGGRTWKLQNIDAGPSLNMFVAVSCPSDVACYAATQAGIVFKSNDGGISWLKDIDLGIPLRGLDCPSAMVCYAASPQEFKSVIAATRGGGR